MSFNKLPWFVLRKNLKVHERTHTGEKFFPCTYLLSENIQATSSYKNAWTYEPESHSWTWERSFHDRKDLSSDKKQHQEIESIYEEKGSVHDGETEKQNFSLW